MQVSFTSAQTAGNLNVVVVGWNDTTAAVSSVIDSKGNVYTRAVGPTARSGQLSQAIYYAKNIQGAAANTNTVTVQFSVPAQYADIRILEYSGLDPVNPVNATAAATGTNATSSSGAAITTSASALIFGANTVATTTKGAGSGFANRVITSPDGDIAEDRIVSATGSYTASAPLTKAGPWVMQMVAFRGAGPAPQAAMQTALQPSSVASLPSPHVISGTLLAVSGSTLTLRTRTGKSAKIDASQALADERVQAPLSVGTPFTVQGTSLTGSGALLATSIVRAKGSSGNLWPPDH